MPRVPGSGRGGGRAGWAQVGAASPSPLGVGHGAATSPRGARGWAMGTCSSTWGWGSVRYLLPLAGGRGMT